MTKKKSTKRALFTSVMALLVCVVMLAGTTFAWFTDSVTSGRNVIQAGNLDAEVYYSVWDKVTGSWADYVKVNKDDPVFNDKALWEPGYTEVVKFKVANEGSLSFKYIFGLYVFLEEASINVAGEELMLSDYIKAGIIDDVSAITRQSAAAAATKSVYDMANATVGQLYPDGNAEGKPSEKEFAYVLHMPTTVGNEANYMTGAAAPVIEFGVSLAATQYTWEEDSFDETYDVTAKYDNLPIATVQRYVEMPEVTIGDIFNIGNLPDRTLDLDVAYKFSTNDTYDEAQNNEFAKWHADFVVSFDKDVVSGTVALGGQYDTFSKDWLSFYLPEVKANTPTRLLGTAGISMGYGDLCRFVEEFCCGAVDLTGANRGTTMSVKLCLFEVEQPSPENNNSWNVETGKFVTVGEYGFTFGSPVPSDLPVAVITDRDELENNAIAWDTRWIYPNNLDQTLETVYTFTPQDDVAAAKASPYADWIADYYVTVNKNLPTGKLVLGGNYGSFGWIGFENPMDVNANEAIPLLGTAGLEFTYEGIVEFVKEFTCGLGRVDDSISGTTVTVELRLTNPDNDKEFYPINVTSYAF